MFERTHKEFAPWIIVRANDKRRARLAVMRRILLSLPYDGRDLDIIGKEDKKIIGEGPSFLARKADAPAPRWPVAPTIGLPVVTSRPSCRQPGNPLQAPQRGVILQRLLEQRNLLVDAVAEHAGVPLEQTARLQQGGNRLLGKLPCPAKRRLLDAAIATISATRPSALASSAPSVSPRQKKRKAPA